MAVTVLAMLAAPAGTAAVESDDAGSRPPPSAGPFGYDRFGPSSGRPFPGAGESYVDPVFGATIRRVTDEYPHVFGGQIYGRNAFWNADGSLVLHYVSGHGYVLLDTGTGEVVRDRPPTDCDSSFDPLDPDVLWATRGQRLLRYSVASGTAEVAKRFDGQLDSLGCSVDAISADGRFMLLALRGRLRVLDLQTEELYAGGPQARYAEYDGWAGMTPDGAFIVTASRGVSHLSYEIDHAELSVRRHGNRYWTLGGHHADLLSASDGRNYHVGYDDGEAIYAVDITLPQRRGRPGQQQRQNRLLVDLDSRDTGAGHFGCVGRGPLRDWCFASIESGDDHPNGGVGNWRPYKQEILAVNVITGDVRRLAHHRSRGIRRAYESEPRVSTDWTGSLVGWASNFNAGDGSYADMYVIGDPLDALPKLIQPEWVGFP